MKSGMRQFMKAGGLLHHLNANFRQTLPEGYNTAKEYQGKSRSDNLAAFGVGEALAEAEKNGKTLDGDTINDKMNDKGATGKYRGLNPDKPLVDGMGTTDELTWVATSGGFNTRDCEVCYKEVTRTIDGKGGPDIYYIEKVPQVWDKDAPSSIEYAQELHKKYMEDNNIQAGTPEASTQPKNVTKDRWLQKEYENY